MSDLSNKKYGITRCLDNKCTNKGTSSNRMPRTLMMGLRITRKVWWEWVLQVNG